MKLYTPTRKTVWGQINTLEDFKKHVARSGQFFGEDKSGPACEFNPAYPCDKTLYQFLGLKGHNGIDIPVVTGTEIIASHNGVVWNTIKDGAGGLWVELWDDMQLLRTYYGHLREFKVTKGQRVKAGDVLAISNNTGLSKGPHLHWGLKQTDDKGNSIELNNGFNGAIDPLPYLTFFKDMTESEVKRLYVLAFYRLPDAGELGYWSGRELLEFLTVAIKDRAEFLKENN